MFLGELEERSENYRASDSTEVMCCCALQCFQLNSQIILMIYESLLMEYLICGQSNTRFCLLQVSYYECMTVFEITAKLLYFTSTGLKADVLYILLFKFVLVKKVNHPRKSAPFPQTETVDGQQQTCFNMELDDRNIHSGYHCKKSPTFILR